MQNEMQKKTLEINCYVLGAGAFGVFFRWLQDQMAFNEEGLVDNSIYMRPAGQKKPEIPSEEPVFSTNTILSTAPTSLLSFHRPLAAVPVCT